MANVSAAMVKELRDQTGAGMMDCKAALSETGGNLDAAVDWLRSAHQSDKPGAFRWMMITAVLGIAFAVLHIREWMGMIGEGACSYC